MPHTADQTYLFIDGEYLRRAYIAAIRRVFDADGDLDPARIRYENLAQRAFFYDCLDDGMKPQEAETQQKFFDEISAISGFHFRPGTIKGEKKRRRQKEVDVQLAVDMLQHGLSKNMEKAILIAGDLDFRPIVEALVLHGIFVEVWYAKGSAAAELPLAADYGKVLTFMDFYNMSSNSFMVHCPLPRRSYGEPPPRHALTPIFKIGKIGNAVVHLYYHDNVHHLHLPMSPNGMPYSSLHADLDVIEKVLAEEIGLVIWD
jgi:uncharacterized LabA/DUF88 family protein